MCIAAATQHLHASLIPPFHTAHHLFSSLSPVSVYSPGNSPHSHNDFEPFEPNSSIPTSLPHLPVSTAPCTTSCMSDYSTVTSMAPHHQPMVYPPTSMMPFDHSLPFEMHPSYPAAHPPPALLPTQFSDPGVESMDPIKILTEDRVTGATIQYYSDNHLPPVSVAEFSAQQFTQLADPGFPHHNFHHEYPAAAQQHAPRGEFINAVSSGPPLILILLVPTGRPTKPRKQKVPTEVDTSEIKGTSTDKHFHTPTHSLVHTLTLHGYPSLPIVFPF